ncbi:MAG: T9SS type A sorting domain-containing protein, partial [Rhodothermia bacterium]|nr:T9SS type A sorting domain-containing protein [Rhodothermia bacterium]
PTYHNESICVLPGLDSDVYTANHFDTRAVKNSKTSATIEINFVDADPAYPWPQAAREAVQYAADVWEAHISSPVVLYVRATWRDLGSPLASGGPSTTVSNFEGAIPDTRYPHALYRAMTGAAMPPPWLLPAEADIIININRTRSWSFATDGVPVAGKYDLVSVAMHEIGHGIGFIGSESYNNGSGGLGDPPLIYDRFVEDGLGTALVDDTTYPNPSTDLGDALTGGDLHFDGPNTGSGSVSPAALYAPDAWAPGTSYSHLDYYTYPAGNVNSLMNPFSSTAEVQHNPGPLACGMIADMGWSLGSGCVNALPVELADFEALVSGRVVLLQWSTLSETDNAGFHVEHHSGDTRFRELGYIDGAGTTSATSTYEFAIPGLDPGNHTFRLRQVDLDGTFDYSPEIEIAVPIPGSVLVEGPYPNPFASATSIDVRVRRTQMVEVNLYDVLGRRVRSVFLRQVEEGTREVVQIGGSDLPTGTYIVRIRGEDFAQSSIIQRL